MYNGSIEAIVVYRRFGGRAPGRSLDRGGRPRTHLGKGEKRTMISRIWHGWTTPGNADTYEALLKEEIFAGIMNQQIRGFRGIQLLRRTAGDEVEFVTIMRFDSLDAVREFAGEDYEAAVVPDKARAVLAHFDGRSQHYEVRAERRSS
jgi:heme-degrading monooxygenase HmoA